MMLLILWLMIGVACGVIASNKGRSGFGWFLLGSLFSVIALVVIAVLPAHTGLSERHQNQLVWDGKLKRCPDCAETIKPAALVCKHRGLRFDEAAA